MRKTALGLTGLLCLATPLQAQATTRIQKTFDKWTVACVEPEESKNRCNLAQSFTGKVQKTGKNVFIFSWTLTRDPEGSEKAVLRAPLGVDLGNGINVQFPGIERVRTDFFVCNRRGCFAEIPMDKAWERELSRKETLKIAYKLRNGREVEVDLDLKGYGDAYGFFNAQLNK